MWWWVKRLAVRCALWPAGVRSFARRLLGARSGFSDYVSPLGSHIDSFLTHRQMEMLSTYGKLMVKWYLGLVDDPCLWIVPGSQNRYRTEREHQCMLREPRGEIPGALRIDLERGQTIFWDGNTVHSGLKPEGMGDRLSLMGGLIDHRAEYHESEKGDQQWMLAENLRPSLPQSTQIYYDNWRTVAESRMAQSVR